MFLTTDEVARLTGKEKPSAQSRWLLAHRYPFEINGRGEVLVLRSVVEMKFGVKTEPVNDYNWNVIGKAG